MRYGALLPLGLGLLLSGGVLLSAVPVVNAQAPQSRLSRLLLNAQTLYLPNRLTLGEESRFVLKGPPGTSVRLYLSPEPSGLTLSNGEALRVGKSHESLEGKIRENGVLEMVIELPKEAGLEGRTMFVEAVTWQADDQSDVSRVQLVDASGRRTADNGLLMALPADPGQMSIMPMMPGMSPQVMNQLTTLGDGLSDERKRELMYDGERDENSLWDRNSLITRPGLTPIK